ncbi:MAG: aminotransferase class V [Sandaracinus sp.]|nr:aminotransferase class V [Sandaracinus sp.]
MIERFPGLADRTYLNSCSYGLSPVGARAVYARWQAVMERFEDAAFGELYGELEAFRDRLNRFVGGDAGSVWVDQSSSALLARIALGLPRNGRHRVVTTDIEFPSAELLFGTLPNVEVQVVPSTDGAVRAEELADAIDERTWMVFVSHATSVTGALLRDVALLAERAHAKGAYVGLDVYQSVGVVPVDLGAMDVDFAVGGGHKWLLGAWDFGWAWLGPRALEAHRPVAAGWIAGSDPFTFDHQRGLARDARRLAAGAPDPLASMLTAVGLDEVEQVGLEAVRSRSRLLTQRVVDRSRWPIAGPTEAEARGGTVCLRVPEAGRVAGALAERDIVVSARRLPDGAEGLRIAPHLYNTTEDIDRCLAALEEVIP